jgi:aspartyl-tRNA(Asn)/glutamyl-tRNA(Gln) amidotransferase subunit A
VNFLDGCAASLPCHDEGTAPVGLMIAGRRHEDRRILAIARVIDEVRLSQS